MQRFTIGDAAELAGDVGPDPRLIGVLAELDGPVDVARLRAAVAGRARRVPLLTHRFVRRGRAPWRTAWQSVAGDPGVHVVEVETDDAVATAIGLLLAGLPESIPMWRLVVLRSPTATHLLFIAHHALMDGATGTAVIAALLGADETRKQGPVIVGRPRWVPLTGLAALTLGGSATSLLMPLTSGFRLVSVETGLAPLRTAARRASATVNDVVLLAIAESLRTVAAGRGERLRRVVVSVPVAGPPEAGHVRNRVGAFLVPVPERRPGETDPALLSRLAARTRWRKRLARIPSSAHTMSALLAGLGWLGWYRPLFEHQRAITTLLTNLRGPAAPLSVDGATVKSLTPISPALGNVTVVFAALSYAGRLRVTARLDRSAWDEADLLTQTLRSALTRFATALGDARWTGPAPPRGRPLERTTAFLDRRCGGVSSRSRRLPLRRTP